MSVECQVNVKSQSELDIGGRETCFDNGAKSKIDDGKCCHRILVSAKVFFEKFFKNNKK